MRKTILSMSLLVLFVSGLVAPVATEAQPAEGRKVMSLTSRSAVAISFLSDTGTKVDMVGTPLMPRARGEAEIKMKSRGPAQVKVELKGLGQPYLLGPEYLTYVLWAVSPQGQPKNLGELRIDGEETKVECSVEMQSFGLYVTAEPYYAVMLPSDVVVVENVLQEDTKGKATSVNVQYELMPRGVYAAANAPGATGPGGNPRDPLDLRQARNAVQIADLADAEKYASDTFVKAAQQLQQAEDSYQLDLTKKTVVTQARSAVQTAEESRMIAVQRRQAEIEQTAKQAAIDAEAQKRAAAEQQKAEAERQKAVAEQRRLNAEQQRVAAEASQRQAELVAERERSERAAAEASQRQAELVAERERGEREAAERAKLVAEQARLQAEADRAALRSKLLAQFNEILETRDTARGLIVNIGDVLFDTGRSSLRPEAREKLARFAGIVLNYPGLSIVCEGHADSTGTAFFNQTLSEDRASNVAEYLEMQGIPMDRISSRGFGEEEPIESNATSAGRRMNRRVEMVVSGDVIGVPLTTGRGR
ncbi:MAG: OmpA family protein [Acidobacteria bacterium]|nr:OmpA family protein [Acidobacteriota bacterium]